MNEARLLSLLTSDDEAVRAQGRELAATLDEGTLGARSRLVLSAYAWVAHARAEATQEGRYREWHAPRLPAGLPDRLSRADETALLALLPPYTFGEEPTLLAPGLALARRHAGKWGGNVHTIAWEVRTYPSGEGITTRVLWPERGGERVLRRVTVRLK